MMKDVKKSIITTVVTLLSVFAAMYGYFILKSNGEIDRRLAIYSNLSSDRSIMFYDSKYNFEDTSIARYYFKNIESFDDKSLNQYPGIAIKIYETNEGKCLIGGMIAIFVGNENKVGDLKKCGGYVFRMDDCKIDNRKVFVGTCDESIYSVFCDIIMDNFCQLARINNIEDKNAFLEYVYNRKLGLVKISIISRTSRKVDEYVLVEGSGLEL